MSKLKKALVRFLERHDSLLHELALNTMADHAPQDLEVTAQRRCQTCRQHWPCPRYRLAQTAEIQARAYKNKLV